MPARHCTVMQAAVAINMHAMLCLFQQHLQPRLWVCHQYASSSCSSSSRPCKTSCYCTLPACRTAATAKKASAISKKAVTGIKEAAHDLSVPSLTKHKLPGQQPEPSRSSSRGPGSHLLGSPLSDLLLVRRSTGEVGLPQLL